MGKPDPNEMVQMVVHVPRFVRTALHSIQKTGEERTAADAAYTAAGAAAYLLCRFVHQKLPQFVPQTSAPRREAFGEL